MIQMVLEGAQYSMECINITQFFYEEALQVSLLAIGTAYIAGNYTLASNALNNPCWKSLNGLWAFGVIYGALIPPVWLAFAGYWMQAGHWAGMYGTLIAEKTRAATNGSTNQSQKEAGDQCLNELTQSLAVGMSVSDRWSNFHNSQACNSWYNSYKKQKGLIKAFILNQALNNYFKTFELKYKNEILEIFRKAYAEESEAMIAFYNGQPTKVYAGNPTSSEKRQTAKTIWSGFNRLQKLAFRNLPGGSVLNGYSVFYNMIWENNMNNSADVVNTGYAFIQIGIGPASGTITVTFETNKKSYKLSEKPIIMNSWLFKKETGSIDPAFVSDLQRGQIFTYKDIYGLVIGRYICGSTTVNSDILAENPKAGQMIDLKDFPIRWNTLAMSILGDYPDQIVVQPIYGLMAVNYPEYYTGGSTISFNTYEPLKDATMTITNADGDVTLFEETTGDDGLFRVGLTKKYEPYTLTIEHADYGTFKVEGLTMEQICQDAYMDITTMVE